ncbi:ATP-dependent protease [Thermococcus chitonophagus]|uniref:ATP-dependent protease n=1 Tax=Thermococcus chitonophagus TaxID=54262 RepID=A0A160VUB7_9EURY|nr:S16 family serine protease [Thermococcus chitonophagus]ASJ16936.1 ATP-dependent protease [Thermococcus chitonophagus]CUX78419.1 putative ATP-dependent protease [Thermococcus chitonophagus]
MKKEAIISLFIAIAFLLEPALAQCPCEGRTVILKAPAVSMTSTGEMIGVPTEFVITVAPGSGHVYVETWPLTEVDMQASARLAAEVAGRVLGIDMSKYDVFIQVKADSPIIGGPSAGGTMTVGIIAALMGWKVRSDVMMTGMINPDGSIGPVGGILEKASAAHQAGAKIFLIPEGQRIQVVTETQRKQIGPITQITTTQRRVDVAKYAEERWGLKVIEVRDIYDAVYYFTGHKLERPKPKGKVIISTSFLESDAKQDYQMTLNYYKNISEKLKNSDVSYSTYSYLKAALDDAYKTLQEAKQALDNGKYYTAMSLDFQARIIIRHVDWYIDVYEGRDLEDIFLEVKKEIDSVESYVSNLTIKGVTMLQAVAASETRIEDAKEYLKEAQASYYKQDYWDAVSNAAYAYERAKTAKLWAELGERYARGEVISREAIKRAARNQLDNARLIVTYITSMFGQQNLQDLINTLNKGEQYYEDGKYSAALFSAMEARIRGEVILDTIGIDNVTVLKDKLKMMKEEAKTAIGLAEEGGTVPLLSMAYYEFAESYEAKGDPQDIITAMIFYQYAKETAMVFLGWKSSSESTKTTTISSPISQNSTEVTTTVTVTKTETVSGTGTKVCGPAIMVLIGALAAIFRRR